MTIGKLEKVELRDIWKNEARDFTTWLYENMEALSEAVNMTLLEPQKEKQVDGSRYSIDIMAETENGEGVIIENQLEQTDHKHLGQLITYLTNMDCKVAIWICKEPRQEHINAVNWLNETSDDDFNFYIVKLEAYKIGNSEPAPFFSVICHPSKEQKEMGKDKKVLKDQRLARKLRIDKCDTIVVPAQEDGFERVFIGKDCWYAIRIKSSRIDQIKWIAAYQVSPVSAITHIAKVKEILPYEDTGKYIIYFDGPAKEIKHIPLGSNSSKSPQGPVYAEKDKLDRSKSVEQALSAFKEKSL